MDSFPLDGSDTPFFKLTLFLEKNQSYLCFTKKWRLVTMKNLHESCYFYETLENGWFQYRSAMNEKIFLGFTKNDNTVKNEVKSHPLHKNRRRNKGARRLHDQQSNVKRRHGFHTKRLTNSNSNVKELDPPPISDYTHDEYLNLAKKQKVTPKKVTNSNSGLLPKLRHANRRNHKG
ncbi:hypothetical protein Bhyg_04605, partial [Pseudolycoriella hygida]